MLNVVNNIPAMHGHNLITTTSLTTMLTSMALVMLVAGMVGALTSYATLCGGVWTHLVGVDSDLAMVYPTTEDLASDSPEAWFFGTLLMEASDVELPDMAARTKADSEVQVNIKYFMDKYNTTNRALAMAKALVELDLAADVEVMSMDLVYVANGKTTVVAYDTQEERFECVEFFGAIETVRPEAKVNVNGCAYDPSNGRIIAQADLPNWTVIAQ